LALEQIDIRLKTMAELSGVSALSPVVGTAIASVLDWWRA